MSPLVVGDAGPIIIGAEWRFFVTNLFGSGLTLLDRVATDKVVTARLNAAWTAEGRVPSDNPEVNITAEVGGTGVFHPFLNEGSRLLYGFRREEPPGGFPPWVCRFGGIILSTEDDSTSDPATTSYVAYDPWQYLYNLPVTIPSYANLLTGQAVGDPIGPDGLHFYAKPGSLIALSILSRAGVSEGPFSGVAHIDMPTSWVGLGTLQGTGYWATSGLNVIEDTEPLTDFQVQQGMSVGEAFDALCATGTMDIVLRPVYDPRRRPGITSDICIYARAGQDRPGAPMSWDKPGRSLVGVNRQTEGTQRANNIRFYSGTGGKQIPVDAVNALSISVYRTYWAQQFFPEQLDPDLVQTFADQQLAERANGFDTIAVSPASERSASPLLEYEPGDRIPVFSSSNMRAEIVGAFRVQEIPINISGDGVETVQQLLVTPDGQMNETSPFETPLGGVGLDSQVAINRAADPRRRGRRN